MKKRYLLGLGSATLLLTVGILSACGEPKEYTITFNSNGGSAVEPVKVKWGDTPNMPENPEKSGYTFRNWYNESELKNVYVPGPVEKDFTLFAGWNVNQYTITFNSLGGTPADPITANFGSNITLPSSSKQYYTFGGWYKDETFKEKFDDKKMPSTNLTVYAKWVPFEVTFTFDPNSLLAEGTMADFQINENSTSKKLPLNKFSLIGHDFVGWATKRDGEVVFADQAEIEHIEENYKEPQTLYAVWERQTLKVNFFTSEETKPYSSVEYKWGEIIRIPGLAPQKEGYKFEGWGRMQKTQDGVYQPQKEYWLKAGDGYMCDSSVKPGDSVTDGHYEVKPIDWSLEDVFVTYDNNFYALFTKQKYTVTFINSLTGQPLSDPITDYYGTTVPLPNQPTVVGYDSLGFSYDEDGNDPVSGGAIKIRAIDKGMKVYTKYGIKSYDLILNNDVDSTQNKTIENVEYMSDITNYLKDNRPVKEGYAFVDWYLDDKFETKFEESEMPSNNLTLYAKMEHVLYTIQFDTNIPGEEVPEIKAYFGDQIITPSFKPTGYDFLGWFENEDLTGDEYVFTTMPSHNLKLYAKVDAKEYTLSFVVDGGDSISPVTGIPYGTSLSEYKDVVGVRTGYTFNYWEKDGVQFDFDKEVMGAGNIQLVANMTINKYSITFDGNGGSTPDKIENVEYNSSLAEYKNIVSSRTGYTFAGWTLNDVDFTFDSAKMPANDITLKAKWAIIKSSITFNSNGGSDVAPVENVAYGTSLAEYATTKIPTRTGYTFAGWTLDGQVFDLSKETMPAKNLNLVASWISNEIEITFVPNGASGTMDKQIIVIDDASRQISANKFVKEGHTFAGWSKNSDASTLDYGAEYVFNANEFTDIKLELTLYPVWNVNSYSISFNSKGGSDVANVPSVNYGTSLAEYATTKIPTRTGYTFAGWTLDGQVFDLSKETMPAKNLNLEASWISNEIEITFVPNGASGTMDKQIIVIDDASRQISANKFVKEGHTFAGWSKNSDASTLDYGAEYVFNANEFTDIKLELTLYPVWNVNSYSISFNSKGGSDVANVPSVNYGTSLAEYATTKIPTRTGYTFAGWTLDGQVFDLSKETMPAKNLNLEASWTADAVNVKVNAISTEVGETSYDLQLDSRTITKLSDSSYTVDAIEAAKLFGDIEGFTFLDSSAVTVTVNPNGTTEITVKYTRNKYTVSFVTETGDLITTKEVEYEGNIGSIPTSVNVEKFTNTYKVGEGEFVSNISDVQVKDDVSVVVKYTAFPGAIFDTNGGTFADGSSQATVQAETGETFDFPENPTLAGYTFDGWYTAADGGTKVDPSTYTMPADGVNLYAHWNINQYTISFSNYGDTEVKSIEQDYLSEVTLPGANKLGYTFDGWYHKVGDNDVKVGVAGDKISMPLGGDSLFAKWIENTITISFNSNGGTAEGTVNDQVIKFTDDSHSIAANPYTRTGYTFAGWATAADGQVVYAGGYTFQNSEFTAPDGKLNLYAVWNINSYSITFDGNGGSTPDKIENVEYNSSLAEYKNIVSSRTGYTFAGWTLNDEDFSLATGKMPAGNITLKAKWTENTITISFNSNGGTAEGTVNDQVIKFTDDSHSIAANPYTRTGYAFAGWATAADGQVVYAGGYTFQNSEFTAPDGKLNLYAVWNINSYSITFDGNGGSTPDKIENVEYNSSLAEYKNIVSSRTGYTFAGWTLNDEDFSLATGKMPAGNITLKAKWTANQIVITFSGKDGSGTMEQQTIVVSDDSTAISKNLFTKEGYSFAGWSISATGTTVDYIDEYEFTAAEFVEGKLELHLYALWTVNSYTVTCDLNYEGSTPIVIEGNYGSDIEAPETPTRSGYTFAGWWTINDKGELVSLYHFNTMPAYDQTIKAKWIVNQYQVLYNTNGGSTIVDTTKYDHGSKLPTDFKLPTGEDAPTRKGYVFEGWYIDSTLTTKATNVVLEALTFDGRDIVFYANWTPAKYTITYYVNGSVYETIQYDYRSMIEAPADPVVSGKTFVGWYDESGTPYSFRTMPAESFSLYAKLSDATYTIYYLDSDGKQLYIALSTDADPTFRAFVEKYYHRLQGYNDVYQAIEDAINAQLGLPGYSQEKFTQYVVYATLDIMSDQDLRETALKGGGATPEQAAAIYSGMSQGLVVEPTFYNVINTFVAGDVSAAYAAYLQLQAWSNKYGTIFTDVYNAATAASGGDQTKIVPFATVAMPKYNLLAQMMGAQLGKDPSVFVEFITKTSTQFPTEENKDYLGDIFYIGQQIQAAPAKAMELLELLGEETSALFQIDTEVFEAYEINAYNPLPKDSNTAFDGWTIDVNDDNHTITYRANFVTKMTPVKEISVGSVSNSYINFAWEKVDASNVYGYRVEVKVNGELRETSIVLQPGSDEKELTYRVNGLVKGDIVDVNVYTLMSFGDGYRQESTVFTATSMVDGRTLTSPKVVLDSDPATRNYVHTMEADIGKVTKEGKFFYVTEDDNGNQTYVLFTNTTYTFGGKTVTIEADTKNYAGATVRPASSDLDSALVTNDGIGTVEFKLTTAGQDPQICHAIVRPMPSIASYGADLSTYDNAVVTSDTVGESYKNADYLGVKKETYKVGVSTNSAAKGAFYNDGFTVKISEDKEQTFYNGFKFDVNELATTGRVIDQLDRQYVFTNGNKTYVASSFDPKEEVYADVTDLFVYDKENDVFYFRSGNSGEWTVTISPKEDVKDGYKNTFIPKDYKDNADTKLSRLVKTMKINLTSGSNVYDCEGLRAAYADKNVTNINIHANIDVTVRPSGILYYNYIKDMPSNCQDQLIGKGAEALDSGEVDIVNDGKAILTTASGYGPKVWSINPDDAADGFSFNALIPNGDSYTSVTAYYAGANSDGTPKGTYAIKSANWVQNFDGGKFKLDRYTDNANYLYGNGASVTKYGITSASPFVRTGSDSTHADAKDVNINGNYFTIDASKHPFVKSFVHVTTGGTLATYQIQSHTLAVFVNAASCNASFNNLTVISNTHNTSEILSGSGESANRIAEEMRMTSGGLNGIRSADYNNGAGLNNSKVTLNGVNIYNSLIAMYGDTQYKASYVHVKGTWANSFYGCLITQFKDGSSVIDHAVIESSGGAALHYDDRVYNAEESKNPRVTNPHLNIDLASSRIENYVTGEEQWFKGYTMEIIALGLKNSIDAQVQPFGYTVIQERTNPAGLPGEYFNFVSLSKTDGAKNSADEKINQQAESTHKDDLGANYIFGENYHFYAAFDEDKDLKDIFVETDNTGAPVVDAQGYVNIVVKKYLDGAPRATIGDNPEVNPNADPTIEAQMIVATGRVQLTQQGPNLVSLELNHTYLYFRQYQGAVGGYIQGIIEMFKL